MANPVNWLFGVFWIFLKSLSLAKMIQFDEDILD